MPELQAEAPRPWRRNLEELLIRHEGMKLKPYYDSLGVLTIGIGRNLRDRGVTQDEAVIMMNNDIDIALDDVFTVFSVPPPPLNVPILDPDMPPARYCALVNMAFNLGRARLSGFRRMIKAVKRKAWDLAAREMLDSQWATQVGQRARTLAAMVETGEWQA